MKSTSKTTTRAAAATTTASQRATTPSQRATEASKGATTAHAAANYGTKPDRSVAPAAPASGAQWRSRVIADAREALTGNPALGNIFAFTQQIRNDQDHPKIVIERDTDAPVSGSGNRGKGSLLSESGSGRGSKASPHSSKDDTLDFEKRSLPLATGNSEISREPRDPYPSLASEAAGGGHDTAAPNKNRTGANSREKKRTENLDTLDHLIFVTALDDGMNQESESEAKPQSTMGQNQTTVQSVP